MTLTDAQIQDLFHQYRDELMRRLVSMVNCRETAADLMQETYAKLLALVHTQVVEHPRALLHRIATNLAIDYLRKQKYPHHSTESMEAAFDVDSEMPSPERQLLGKERLQLFMEAIDALPPRSREAFLLYRVYGYTYQEIATRMGITVSGVEKHLMRALARYCSTLDSVEDMQE